MSKMQWSGRVVTDTRGDSGAIILSDKSTAYEDLKDWLHDYYDIDDDEARQYAMGLFGLSEEFDSERSAEYLYAAAHEN